MYLGQVACKRKMCINPRIIHIDGCIRMGFLQPQGLYAVSLYHFSILKLAIVCFFFQNLLLCPSGKGILSKAK